MLGQPSPTALPKAGYIRFWAMLPAAAGSFELRKTGATGPEAILARARPYAYPGYIEVAVGKHQLTVVKTGLAETPFRNLVVDVKPDTFFTVAIMPAAQGANVEFTEDTVDPETNNGTLTIRNCYPGITITVSAGSQRLIDSLGEGRSFVARDLPAQILQLSIETKLPNGRPASSLAEADFKVNKRATLLIIPDSYGRFRPRVTIDGSN